MRAYIPHAGAPIWVMTEETAISGKGRKTFATGEEMFTETVFDPVMLANGNALDPEMYLEGFPHKMWKAARSGFYVFHEGGEEMFAIHAKDLEVR